MAIFGPGFTADFGRQLGFSRHPHASNHRHSLTAVEKRGEPSNYGPQIDGKSR